MREYIEEGEEEEDAKRKEETKKRKEGRKVRRKGEAALFLTASLSFPPRILVDDDDGPKERSGRRGRERGKGRKWGDVPFSSSSREERREPASTFAYYGRAGVRWPVPRHANRCINFPSIPRRGGTR